MDYNEVKVNLRKFGFPLSTENALNQIRKHHIIKINENIFITFWEVFILLFYEQKFGRIQYLYYHVIYWYYLEKSLKYKCFIILETIINGETSRKQHLNEDLAMDLISEFIFCETNEEGKSTKVIVKLFLFDRML